MAPKCEYPRSPGAEKCDSTLLANTCLFGSKEYWSSSDTLLKILKLIPPGITGQDMIEASENQINTCRNRIKCAKKILEQIKKKESEN